MAKKITAPQLDYEYEELCDVVLKLDSRVRTLEKQVKELLAKQEEIPKAPQKGRAVGGVNVYYQNPRNR